MGAGTCICVTVAVRTDVPVMVAAVRHGCAATADIVCRTVVAGSAAGDISGRTAVAVGVVMVSAWTTGAGVAAD